MLRSQTERAFWQLPMRLCLVAVALCVLAGGRPEGAPPISLATLAITDSFTDAKVRSDGAGAYVDYRLQPGCVEAAPDSRGFLHAVLNRKIDAAGTRCNPLGSDRQYRVLVTNAAIACQRLAAAYGSLGVTVLTDTSCELVYTDNPRIRIEEVFRKGATSTPFALLTEMYLDNGHALNGRSYEIQTLANVPVAAPHPDRRVLTYTGQAILSEFGNGRPRAVGEAFDLDFQMSVQRGVAP